MLLRCPRELSEDHNSLRSFGDYRHDSVSLPHIPSEPMLPEDAERAGRANCEHCTAVRTAGECPSTAPSRTKRLVSLSSSLQMLTLTLACEEVSDIVGGAESMVERTSVGVF